MMSNRARFPYLFDTPSILLMHFFLYVWVCDNFFLFFNNPVIDSALERIILQPVVHENNNFTAEIVFVGWRSISIAWTIPIEWKSKT